MDPGAVDCRRRRRRRGIAWLPDNKRFLFLSEKSGYMHLYALDVTADPPQARALTTGKWEVTMRALSSDRKTMFLTTNEVHPGERHFYTMSVDGGARTRDHDDDRIERSHGLSRREVARAHLFLQTKPPELLRDAVPARRQAGGR